MLELTIEQKVLIQIIPVLFAITLHEVAHGWVASRLGDKTAEMMGRITLNPIKHIDPIGTLLVPALCLAMGTVIFGWAKPVPVDWRNLRNLRRDAALVAAAGPLSNLLMAIFWGYITKLGVSMIGPGEVKEFSAAVFLAYTGYAGITINLLLMILNLLPIPPLDGSRVVSSLLPVKAAQKYNIIEPYGLIILMVLIVSGALTGILNTPLQWGLDVFKSLYGF